jgi:hypothetical protein
MRRFRPGRPSPALVISILALIVALGGTSYAAITLSKNSVGPSQLRNGAVTTSKIKSGAVTASKVKSHSLTGKQINVSSLGTVPNASHASTADLATNATNATNADTAASAANATTVGGETVQKFFFQGPVNTAASVILHLDGLSLSAGCDGSTNPIFVANSDTNATQLKVEGNASGTAFSNSWSTSGGPTRNLDLVLGHGLGAGTGTYSTSDGHVVSFDYSFDNPSTYGNLTECTVVGQAIGS